MSIFLRKTIPYLLFFISYNAICQNGIIKGNTIDNSTGKPVEFATVTLLSALDSSLVKGDITDSLGYFEFTNISIGEYVLIVSSIEYQKIVKGNLTIHSPEQLLSLGKLGLITDSKLLGEVVVNGSKPVIERVNGSVLINMNSSVFKSTISVIDALKKAPGIQVKSDGTVLMRNSITPKILIDGKDVPMSPTELHSYLNNLRPDEIESIEIINNPSAKYDSQYKGIINLHLKRDKSLGFAGSISTAYRQNLYGGLNNNMSLSYKTPKVTYSSRAGFVDMGSIYDYLGTQILDSKSTLITSTSIPSTTKNILYEFGVDYSITKNKKIGVLIKGFISDTKLESLSESVFSNNSLANISQVMEAKPHKDNYSLNTNYEINTSDNQFRVSGSLANYRNQDNQDIINHNAQRNLSTWKANLGNNVFMKIAQLDYSKNIFGGKLDIGSKISSISTDNNLRYDTLANAIFTLDKARTNNFVYDENILSFYSNFRKSFNNVEYQFGLRVENTNTIANSITLNQITNRSYLRLLPSLSINYTLNDDESLSLEFSRRLKRPNFDDLNPFRFYVSPFTYSEGNPFLLPQETNLLTLGYNYKNLGVLVGVGQDKNEMTSLPLFSSKTNITAFTMQNIDSYNYYSLELNFPLSITNFWKIQHNLNSYLTESKITYLEKLYSQNITSFIFSGSQVFTFLKKWNLDISYDYHSASGDALYAIKPFYSINLGIQKAFYKNRLNVKAAFNDVLYSNFQRVYFREQSIYNIDYNQKNGTRRFTIQLSYRFGKSTFKVKNVGSTEEESRTKR
jgi:outer membrane receptor protein involved in Fe transport